MPRQHKQLRSEEQEHVSLLLPAHPNTIRQALKWIKQNAMKMTKKLNDKMKTGF